MADEITLETIQKSVGELAGHMLTIAKRVYAKDEDMMPYDGEEEDEERPERMVPGVVPPEDEEVLPDEVAVAKRRAYQMGYKGVQAALDVIAGKPVERRIDTGVTVATKGNMGEAEVHKILFPLEK